MIQIEIKEWLLQCPCPWRWHVECNGQCDRGGSKTQEAALKAATAAAMKMTKETVSQ